MPDTVLRGVCSNLFGCVASEKLLFIIYLQHCIIIINVHKTGLLLEWSCKQIGEAAVTASVSVYWTSSKFRTIVFEIEKLTIFSFILTKKPQHIF